jgi:hypothetical protein
LRVITAQLVKHGRQIQRVLHVGALNRAAAIGAHADVNACIEQSAHRRKAGAYFQVGRRIVLHADAGPRQDVDFPRVQPDAMDECRVRLHETDPV